MDSQTERALRDKADTWKVNDLEHKFDRAKARIDQLESTVRSQDNYIANHREAIRLLVAYLESSQADTSELNRIVGYL